MPPADFNENQPTLLSSEDNLGSRGLYVRKDSRELWRCDVHSPPHDCRLLYVHRGSVEQQQNATECILMIVLD